MTAIHASLSDKALLAAAQAGSVEAAELLTRRLLGHVTPAAREAWPLLRRAKRISVRAARHILTQTPPHPSRATP